MAIGFFVFLFQKVQISLTTYTHEKITTLKTRIIFVLSESFSI